MLDSELGLKNIKINNINKLDDYLLIELSNGQKILTNKYESYDVSSYGNLESLFSMEDKFCGVFRMNFSIYVVNLKTMEVLFEDTDAYYVNKNDNKTLYVIMRESKKNSKIYNIETKEYLPAPDDYEFENSLGNNLYVFREQHNSDTNFYDYKRCVINVDGKILLKDIDGWIELSNNHLIISKKNQLYVVKINEDSTLDIKTIEKNEKIIAEPTYYNGNLILMEKGFIKIYTPNLKLVNEFIVDELNEVIDYEIVSDTLKLCLPHTIDGEQVNKHLFINLNTGKSISHLRIEGYPYWMPVTYIGQDSIDSKITDYHFYNSNFDPIIKVSANSYESVGGNKECIFVIRISDGENEYKQLLNVENGNIKIVDYDYVRFHKNLPYGYGVKNSTQKMDFFDENFNVIISNFDYKKLKMDFRKNFWYFIVNNYICVSFKINLGGGLSQLRTIIQNLNGDVILDSVQHRCYAIGNFIKIVHNENSEFLNTLNGEIKQLSISAQVDEKGKIDLNKTIDFNTLLTIGNNTQLNHELMDGNQDQIIKMLIPEKNV